MYEYFIYLGIENNMFNYKYYYNKSLQPSIAQDQKDLNS